MGAVEVAVGAVEVAVETVEVAVGAWEAAEAEDKFREKYTHGNKIRYT